RDPELHARPVLLVVVDEIRRELGRLSHHDRQHAGRLGIEGPAMAHPRDAERSPEEGDDPERRRARALVDDEHARRADRARTPRAADHPGRASRMAARTCSVAASSVARTTQPAALGWPPPPDRPATRFTSTTPFARRVTVTAPP